MRRCLAILGLVLLAGWPIQGQCFDMAKSGASEIQVYADNGIEWLSEQKRVIAHGNAKAVRGNMTVTADTLTAYYRQGASGNEIWRLDAEGNVTIANPTDTATGNKGVYDLDKAVFVLKGSPARLVTPTQTFTADEELEYWEVERMAVLRGNGVAVQGDKKIQADVLTAHFRDRTEPAVAAQRNTQSNSRPASGGKGAKGGSSSGSDSMDLERADAYGHVILTTAQEVVTGDRGDYNMVSGIATVAGSVKITREGNELNGGYAHVDLNSGISKLFGAPPGTANGDHRARGTFVPGKKEGEQQPRAVFRGTGPNAQPESGQGKTAQPAPADRNAE